MGKRNHLPLPLLFLCVVTVVVALAGTANAAGYYQNVTVTGSTDSALNIYQVMYNVWNTSGTSTGTTIYTNGHTRSDWADIRFKDANGSTVSYYIDPITKNASFCQVYVNLTNVPVSPNTIVVQILYGKETSTTSSGSNTMSS
jgi:hypothetical protein